MKKCFAASIFVVLFIGNGLVNAQNRDSVNQAARIEGQVVCCLDCWAKEDRWKIEYGTAEDLLAAKTCVGGGDPTLLAVRNGDKFVFYQLEEGKFKLPGENWLEFVGKHVAVTGSIRKKKKVEVLRVDELEVTAESIGVREAKAAIGKTVELKLNDLFGTQQSLSQFKGRIVILNFWATYCLPCREEMPDLAAIQNEYAAFGVQVIGASSDTAEDREKVLKFIKQTKVNFPIWLGASGAEMSSFGLGEALPGTVVLDRDGKIVKVISGVVNKAELKDQMILMLSTAEASMVREEPVSIQKPPKSKTEKKKVSSVPS